MLLQNNKCNSLDSPAETVPSLLRMPLIKASTVENESTPVEQEATQTAFYNLSGHFAFWIFPWTHIWSCKLKLNVWRIISRGFSVVCSVATFSLISLRITPLAGIKLVFCYSIKQAGHVFTQSTLKNKWSAEQTSRIFECFIVLKMNLARSCMRAYSKNMVWEAKHWSH